MKLFDLKGKVAIVTGGNGGIGLGMATGLAEAGADIVLAARNPEKAAIACATLRNIGRDAEFVPFDILSETSCVSMVAKAHERFGRIDILVNNAGASLGGAPESYSIADFKTVIDTNLTGALACSQAAYPHMKKAGGGKIINVASVAAYLALPRMTGYAPSKAGLVQLTRVLASAWAKDNIQVNSILPGWVDTINASKSDFTVHLGDIKSGSQQCTTSYYETIRSQFDRFTAPLVYTPGDNEWTDCHRTNNGGYDTLERLAHLRRVMFPSASSLGQNQLLLEHQGKPGEKFVENTRFSHGGVVFAGLNVPGSNNNLVLNAKECTDKSARKAEQCDAANAEYLERDAANVAWMASSFAQAKAHNARGLVLVILADPGFDLPETEDLDESAAPGVIGYRNFIHNLVLQTEQFQGQVLLVHGDTHFFKVDKPLYSPTKLLPNLTRLQTFGSPSLHWVKVTVDPTSDNVFNVQPVIVRQP